MSKHVSALSALTPTEVWNVQTGLQVTDWQTAVTNLLQYVQEECNTLTYSPYRIDEVVETWDGYPKAKVYATRNGVRPVTSLPVSVKAKSRVGWLVQDALLVSLLSYRNNPNPHKRYPTFSKRVNLGAVDRQMATLSLTENRLTLSWKVWNQELLFMFQIPEYALQRDIIKWSLPTVQISRKRDRDGAWVDSAAPTFLFAYEEARKLRPKHKKPHVAGCDIGQAEPFTLAILNQQRKRVAHYTSSARLRNLSHKRSRLIAEKKCVYAKLDAYKNLDHDPQKQEKYAQTLTYLTQKIRTLGTEIAHLTGTEITTKLTKHEVNELKVENLSWVHGQKYGGRWNHSTTQAAITHALSRENIRVTKVSPKNTSQTCSTCSQPVTHNTKKRTVRCAPCQTILDRDFNAAVNIAKRTPTYPGQHRTSGGDSTAHAEVTHTDKYAESVAAPAARLTT